MHVVIVGGGIVGTATAAAVAGNPDTDVTLLERDELGCGATAASAAVFTTQQPSPDRADHAFRERAWETYGPLVEDGTVSYERVGHLTVAESEATAARLRDAVEPLRSFGLDAEWVDAGDLPGFDVAPADHEGALYTPEEGYFDPAELVDHFASRAEERGATIRTDAPVTGIETADGAVDTLHTERSVLDVDAVVDAAGPWALEVGEFVGLDLPLRHTVGPMLAVEGADHDLPFTVFESKRYVRPVGDAGAYAGKYLTNYEEGDRLDPDEPRSVGDAFRDEAFDLFETSIPPLADADVTDEWVGLRTVTPDGRPLVGESDVGGFYLAAGMSGLGVTRAPAVADLLAEALGGDEPDELSRFDPDRFA